MSEKRTSRHYYSIQKKKTQNKTNKHDEKECKLGHYELIHNLIHELSQIAFGLKALLISKRQRRGTREFFLATFQNVFQNHNSLSTL